VVGLNELRIAIFMVAYKATIKLGGLWYQDSHISTAGKDAFNHRNKSLAPFYRITHDD
jgi:hypothetical protein